MRTIIGFLIVMSLSGCASLWPAQKVVAVHPVAKMKATVPTVPLKPVAKKTSDAGQQHIAVWPVVGSICTANCAIP